MITSTTPTCGRQSGNDSKNATAKEGKGCSAVDLCAQGWHVCLGSAEVDAKTSHKGCTDADASALGFFAVAQHSTDHTICDLSANDNDVFGCGSADYATSLTAGNSCGVLNRALASANSDPFCGENKAGPWSCTATNEAPSHLHESGIVTKDGCPETNPPAHCSGGGYTFHNWERGGVLCCKD